MLGEALQTREQAGNGTDDTEVVPPVVRRGTPADRAWGLAGATLVAYRFSMEISPEAHERIRALYEKGLFLSAWRAALSIGDPRSFTGTRDRLRAGRLLAQVGAMRAGHVQYQVRCFRATRTPVLSP